MLYISTFVQSVSGLQQVQHVLLRRKYYTLTFCIKQIQKGQQGDTSICVPGNKMLSA